MGRDSVSPRVNIFFSKLNFQRIALYAFIAKPVTCSQVAISVLRKADSYIMWHTDFVQAEFRQLVWGEGNEESSL